MMLPCEVPDRRLARLRAVALTVILAALASGWLTDVRGVSERQLARRSAAGLRKATTVAALRAYPLFYHAQPVRVRGHLQTDRGTAQLFADEESVFVVSTTPGGSTTGGATLESAELLATFFDAGRLEAADPRLTGLGIQELTRQVYGKDWPAPGELLVLAAETWDTPSADTEPSLAALALDPLRHVDRQVTLVGRFRGRNLFGDLPEGVDVSRWDFVLQLAEAAVWVTGKEPKGRGFELRLDARRDTGRWLEVTGTVRTNGRLAWIEATDLALAEEPTDVETRVPAAPTQGPPPEVIFSAPTQGESDVPLDTSVRLQFSRDLDPSSLQGNVLVGYLDAESTERGEPAVPTARYTTRYDPGRRVLHIEFVEPLERFRTLTVRLTEGIRATDDAALAPWTLSFILGGT